MKLIVTTTIIFLNCFSLQSQTVHLLADIKPGAGSSNIDANNASIAYHDVLLFSANDGTHGNELWIYDGTNVALLKDIYPGAANSNSKNYFLINDKVLFTAQDSAHGVEWWTTDGTAGGTKILKDIFAGPAGGVSTFDASGFFVYKNELYFSGADRSNDFELWKTNGTVAGTKLVKNISPDAFSTFYPSYPRYFAEHQGTLYFSCREGFWKTNGTTAGTVLVEDKDPEDVFGLEPSDMLSNGDYLLFIQNTNLWSSDGTAAGTKKIQNLGNVSLNWFGNRFTRLGNIVLFPGSDATHGEELWKSDGTSAGTSLVVDLDPGTDGYTPQNNLMYKNKMYYKGDNGNTGIELFSSDGTSSGTKLVRNIGSGSNSGFYLPTEIFTDSSYMYMSAGEAFNTELWISDGTTAGTYGIDINPDGESHPLQFNSFNGKIFFFAKEETTGWEPHILDLTTGLNENNASAISSVSIYPNPAKDFLHIDNPENLSLHTSVYNIQGVQIIPESTTSDIDIRYLTCGSYFLRIEDQHGRIQVRKVMVVK